MGKGSKMKNIEITCCNCLEKFTKFSGDVDERMCMTCILIDEAPEIIKPTMVKVPKVHRRGYIMKKIKNGRYNDSHRKR